MSIDFDPKMLKNLFSQSPNMISDIRDIRKDIASIKANIDKLVNSHKQVSEDEILFVMETRVLLLEEQVRDLMVVYDKSSVTLAGRVKEIATRLVSRENIELYLSGAALIVSLAVGFFLIFR
tara:strand:- start:6142 stop:6507 length:366 start_codon:yes stop_codon:yes gene_type:complete